MDCFDKLAGSLLRYIIFICTFDPFSDGRHIYTFENRCLEDLSLALPLSGALSVIFLVTGNSAFLMGTFNIFSSTMRHISVSFIT